MPFLSSASSQSSKGPKGPEGTVPIPKATGAIPLLGTLPFLDPDTPMASVAQLAERYGEIYKLIIPGRPDQLVCSTHALVNELCDETRFEKHATGGVFEILRDGVPEGIFTAFTDEDIWQVAHRILVPAFGPVAIQGMFDDMYDIAAQLAMKWARHGPAFPIMATDDFTRLTLDTIALCSMGFRFNSYYHDDLHPFVQAMNLFLRKSSDRSNRPLPQGFYDIFARGSEKQWAEICAALRTTAREVLEERKKNPGKRRDLLTAMLEGVDPKTGQKLNENAIIDNLITFLVAGHETTSGMLAFAFYELLKSPADYRRAQQEVDEVVGTGRLRPEHLPKLHFLNAVFRETLRLCPTIPGVFVRPLKDDIIGGKYFVAKNEHILMTFYNSHLDPAVFGETAKQFVPERMLGENFERLNREFPNCWKPFGNGLRGCIGRPFAWQEALIVTAILLQNFNFVEHDPNYKLIIKEALTLKPNNFYMRARLRHGMTAAELEHRLARTAASAANSRLESSIASLSLGSSSNPAVAVGKPINIYYGSNSGTCEALAHRLATDASAQGFHAVTVDVLDAARESLPKESGYPVVLITASYEGQPPDNAAHFVAWLEGLQGGSELAGFHYAVYGCGHRDWTRTLHRIPKLLDSKLSELGATRLAPLGISDAANGNTFVDFETWEFEKLWPALAARYGVEPSKRSTALETTELPQQTTLDVQISHPRSSTLRQDVGEAVVVSAKLLTAPGAPAKRHIEIQLPKGISYSAGDYLTVLPLNPKPSVDRAMRRFGLAWDAHVTIRSGGGHTTLPTDQPVSAQGVLSAYVELAQPATKRGVLALAEAAGSAEGGKETKKRLLELAGEAYQTEISGKRVSVLDLLEQIPAVEIPFGTFLSLLPPMRVRQYSISSSPHWNPGHATVTYSVLDEPSLAAVGPAEDEDGQQPKTEACHRHLGVATTYLASLAAGDHLHVAVRPSHVAFHLPSDAERTPLVCIAAGSGLAPFRGFLQERAALLGAGRKLAPMLLFYGCRDPDVDDLYREELDRWEGAGAASVRRAYSRRTDVEESKGCHYVQDRLRRDRDEVAALWDGGAHVFVCGSRALGEGVKEVVFGIVGARYEAEGEADARPSRERVQEWYESVRNKRYAADVFE